MYKYKAKVTRVVDGDTIVCDIDLGFYIHLHDIKFRLLGINAPEMKGESLEHAKESKRLLESLVLNREIVIETEKSDAFGRWLATVYLHEANINQLMIRKGMAVSFMA